MNEQDTANVTISFLLLLPWIGRAAISAVAAWRGHIETKQERVQANMSANPEAARDK
jgi:hypothetical protein